ncbi:TPA: transposase [Salmonella enterica]|uniref:Transposase n=1 Tax=Salmonella enterica TaxID=28901 RepID=A0A743P0B3_SALER|nr:transposase [Salmonella enterica]
MNKKRQFTADFKKEAVALVTEQNYTVARAASSLPVAAGVTTAWHRVSLPPDQRCPGLRKPPQ